MTGGVVARGSASWVSPVDQCGGDPRRQGWGAEASYLMLGLWSEWS